MDERPGHPVEALVIVAGLVEPVAVSLATLRPCRTSVSRRAATSPPGSVRF